MTEFPWKVPVLKLERHGAHSAGGAIERREAQVVNALRRGHVGGAGPSAKRHSRFVCRARIDSEVSPKRGRSFNITSSKKIICAVSNSEPIGKTERLGPLSSAMVCAGMSVTMSTC